MHYLVYKVTNTINGKYYIGAHKTKNVNDNYFGSGKIISEAIEKYGKESFVKEILFYASSEEEMFLKEKEIITKDVVDDPLSYNLTLGGLGGCRLTTEQAKNNGKKCISKIHIINRETDHYSKLGLLNSKRLKGKVNKNHSQWMKQFFHKNKLLWWNNGNENRRSVSSPGIDWKRGRK